MNPAGRTPITRWLVVVVAVVSMALMAGCSESTSDDNADRSSTGTASSTRSGQPSGASTTSTPTDPGTCTVTACPKLPTPSAEVMKSGVTDSNADTAVPAYLTGLFNDLDQTWGGWFGELDWGSPDPGRKLIEPGTTFRTECIDDESEAQIPSNLANAFFCPVDVAPNGSGQPTKGTVVLPVQTFQKIWQGNVFGVPSPFVGDFTAAIVVAHEYGHNIVYRIADVLDIPESQEPRGNNSELIADCLAGNWAATVFQRDALSPKDILQVAALLPIIGDPGPNQGHGTITERARALTVGLTGPQLNRQGQPVDCLSRYWPEKFGS